MLEGLMWLIVAIVGAILGGVAGFWLQRAIGARRLTKAIQSAEEKEERALKLLADAKAKQRELLLEARDEALKSRAAAEAEIRERRQELQRQERRIAQRDDNLDRRAEALERREKAIAGREKEIEEARAHVDGLRRKQLQELERISAMSSAEAKELLLKAIEEEALQDASRRLREIEAQIKEEAEDKAREILTLAIQRCASEAVTETTVSVVPIPSDEMKGRIIGREGRNIRALENATGVDLIIDDTPDAVTLSSFDPVRREVARLALNKLIQDGRIHPARIEEVVQRAKQEVDNVIRQEGEAAALLVGVHDLHPELIKILGREKFRFSYGQNVLQHSIEVAQLAGIIAAELGADVEVAKKAGLLHDIGKVMDQGAEGTHALLGSSIAQRLGKSPEVVHAIAAHHGEEEPKSTEAIIVAVADAISASRPGARRESLEHYLKRLEALEGIANSFPGVEKSFAIQAGREIRILVKPEEIDDLASVRLARDLAKKIEENLEYPGQIKVTVVRETRAIEYAK